MHACFIIIRTIRRTKSRTYTFSEALLICVALERYLELEYYGIPKPLMIVEIHCRKKKKKLYLKFLASFVKNVSLISNIRLTRKCSWFLSTSWIVVFGTSVMLIFAILCKHAIDSFVVLYYIVSRHFKGYCTPKHV